MSDWTGSSRKTFEWMNDDPIEMVLILLGTIFKDHLFFFRATLLGAAAYLQMFNLIFFIQALTTRRWYLRQFITGVILQQPGCCGVILLSHFIKHVLKFQNIVFSNCWAVNSCGETTAKKILQDSKICKISCVGQTVLCIITYLLFCPIVGDEDRLYFIVMFSKEQFGEWGKVPIFFFYMCLPVLCYGTIAALYGCLYISYHIRFQLYLLNGYVQGMKIRDFNELDQEAVYEELSVLIAHHVRVKKVAKALFTVQSTPLLLYHITGALAAVTGLYFVLTNVSPSSNFRMIFVALIGGSISLTAAICSQCLIDESNQLFLNISNTPWIYLNEKNKKAILMLLLNSSEPIRLTCFGLMDINYNFLLFLARMIYSLIAVVIKIK